MSRDLRTAASWLANLFAALLVTSLIQAPIMSLLILLGTQSPVLRVQTPAGLMERAFAVNVLAAILLGYFAYRIFRPIIAKWIWLAGVLWIATRGVLLLGARPKSVLESWTAWVSSAISFTWSSLAGIGCGSITDVVGFHCWQSFLLTQAATRLVAYSVGAVLCARLGHTGTFPLADAWLVRFRKLPLQEGGPDES